jgi:type VI protein secretion system component Hcp
MALGIFLELEGITGGSVDATHGGKILVEGWSFSVGTAEEHNKSFDLTVIADQATPRLFVQCLAGGVIPSGKITVRDGSAVDIWVIRMSGVTVTRLGATALASLSRPTAEISLARERVAGTYTPVGPDGRPGTSVTGGWDLIENREWLPE